MAATLQYQVATKNGFIEQFIQDEVPFGGSFSASLTNGGSSGWFAIGPAYARVRAAFDWGAGGSGGTSVNVTVTDTMVMQRPPGGNQFAAALSVTIGVSDSLAQSGGSAGWTAGAELQSSLYFAPFAGFVQPRIGGRASGSESAAFGSSGTGLPATFITGILPGTTDVFLFNTPIFLWFSCGASADSNASGGGFARANLEDTILWLGIVARDADGNIIEGVTFNSTGGFDWGSPPAVIPVPASGWLLLSGCAVIGGWRRRQRLVVAIG
jgi:hypothetical protein